jgi:hypothetical protein
MQQGTRLYEISGTSLLLYKYFVVAKQSTIAACCPTDISAAERQESKDTPSDAARTGSTGPAEAVSVYRRLHHASLRSNPQPTDFESKAYHLIRSAQCT